jgi:hypothetical protein
MLIYQMRSLTPQQAARNAPSTTGHKRSLFLLKEKADKL